MANLESILLRTALIGGAVASGYFLYQGLSSADTREFIGNILIAGAIGIPTAVTAGLYAIYNRSSGRSGN